MRNAESQGAPRNRRLFEQGRALREEIREMLLTHSPIAPPLTAKHIQARLRRIPAPSIRAIQWHVSAIRRAQIQPPDLKSGRLILSRERSLKGDVME